MQLSIANQKIHRLRWIFYFEVIPSFKLFVLTSGGGVNMQKAIYDAHYTAIFSYILYLTSDKELTHDLLQETFYRYFSNTNKTVENEKAFLLRIARNLVYDHFRKKRLLKFFTLTKDDRVDTAPLPVEIVTQGEDTAALYSALQQLKFSYRETVVLRYIEEYSVKEVAKILGCSEAQVKNNTARGLQKLRLLLEGSDE